MHSNNFSLNLILISINFYYINVQKNIDIVEYKKKQSYNAISKRSINKRVLICEK